MTVLEKGKFPLLAANSHFGYVVKHRNRTNERTTSEEELARLAMPNDRVSAYIRLRIAL